MRGFTHALLLLALLSGCGGYPHYTPVLIAREASVAPAPTGDGARTEPAGTAPAADPVLRDLAPGVEFGGIFDSAPESGPVHPVLKVVLRLDNRAQAPVSLDLSQVEYRDDLDRRVPLARAYRQGRLVTTLELAPGTRNAIHELHFDLPPGYRFDRVLSFRVHWRPTVAGAAVPLLVKFHQSDPYAEEWAYRHRWGYHDPYWCDHPYAYPYGHPHVSFSYGFGISGHRHRRRHR